MSNAAPTLQEQMKSKLVQTGIPHKEIQVYGSQVVITSAGLGTARRWNQLLREIGLECKGTLQSLDPAKVNKGGVAHPTMVKVWRTYGRVK